MTDIISGEIQQQLDQGLAALQKEIKDKFLNAYREGRYLIKANASKLFIQIIQNHPDLTPIQREAIAMRMVQEFNIKRDEINEDPNAYPDIVRVTRIDGPPPELKGKIDRLLKHI